MNLKSLNIIEYNKLLDLAAAFASSQKAKLDIKNLLPMQHIYQIDRQINLTDEAYQVLMTFPNLHIGLIKDVSEAIDLAKIGSVLSPEELLDIAGTLRTARLLARSIKDVQSDEIKTPLLNEISRYIGSFRNIEDRIFDSIISASEIADNASKTLYTIRRKIESTKTNIRIRLEKLTASQSMQKYLQDAIVTIRGGRFVVPVKSEHKAKVEGLVHDKSKGGSTFYIEPSFVIEMNNELKSLIIDEETEIRRILAELSKLVKDRAQDIKITYESVCELDFIFAKARFAHSIGGVKPIISEQKIIELKQARHPFIDREKCVPIDFKIGNSYSALIITGPNTGGKTVAIKTVALLTAMALSGFFVPANAGAKFGIFDKIYADIGDEQSIDQSLSTFSSHMQNIVTMVKDADQGSLLLFDELGAGTDPTEGAALAISILKEVKDKGATVIATTHYSELKQFALLQEGFQNASVEFDVEKLMPTYRLMIGIPGKSNAFEISRRLGLNEKIIDEAKKIIKHEDIAFEDILSEIELKLSQAEKDRQEASEAKTKAARKLKELEDKTEKLRQKSEKVINDAKTEARQIVANTKAEMDLALKDLKEVEKSINSNSDVLSIKQRISKTDKKNMQKSKTQYQDNGIIPQKLEIGKEYFVVSLAMNATLLEISKKTDDLKVMAGAISLFVKKDDLREASKRKAKKKIGIYDPKNTLSYGTSINAVSSSKTEIDLHGKNVLEAIHELDKFLDEAMVSGLKEVFVIHGLGSGKLKREIISYLKKQNYVKRLRSGVQGEGGAGVTVVRLK